MLDAPRERLAAQIPLVVQNTGAGQTFSSQVQSVAVAADALEPRLVLSLGFGTAETVEPGEWLDSYTVTLQRTDKLATSICLTFDAGGVVVAPPTPGGLSLGSSLFLLTPVAYPDLVPRLPFLQAYDVSLSIPEQFQGGLVDVYFDLFDNQNAKASQGWHGEVYVTNVPEPETGWWISLALVLGWTALRGRFFARGPGRPARGRDSWLVVSAFLLALPTTGWAQQRTLTLDGVRMAFVDISTQAEVYFTSVRFNRALDQWNVEVTVSNRTAAPIQGPLVLLIEGTTGVTGVLQPDGVDQGQPYFDLSPNLRDGALPASGKSQPRTLSLGYLEGGSPRVVARVLRRAPTATFSLALARSLDEAGHPLPGVTVAETGPAGSVTLLTDSSSGVVTLGQGNGQHHWRFSADGYLPAWREGSLSANTVAPVANPRLVPRASNPVTVGPGLGGAASNALDTIRITFGGASFDAVTAVTLTPLAAQTLPALLPLGWSPLQAFWVEWDGALTEAATLRLWPWGRIEYAETAVLAKWNATALQWEVRQTGSGNLQGPVTFNLSEPGPYALVVADAGIYAPPPVVVGQPLLPSLQPVSDLSLLAALGTVTPPSSAASRSPALVTAIAAVNFRGPTPLPSGLLLGCEVSDAYELTSGARLTPPRYEAFVAAFQRPGDSDPNTLEATFPMRPLLLLVEELTRATVTVDVIIPGPFQGGVLDADGGEVMDGSIRLLANAGDLARPQAVELRQLDPDAFPGLVQAPQQIVAAFELLAESLPPGKTLVLRLPSQAGNGSFVLARVVMRDGSFGLEPLERFTSDASGKLTSAEPADGERLSGVSGAGRWVLVRLPAPQGLVHGVARDGLGRPQADIPVRVDGQPWLVFSASDGGYRLLAPQGEATVAVLDPNGGRASLSSLVVTDPAIPVGFDLSTVPAGPRVMRITPAPGMTNVSRVTQVVVEFSKPVNPATLLAGGIRLLDPDGQPVVGAVSLNLANTVATLLPTDPLAPDLVYRIAVSTQVTDLGGRGLEGPNTAEFTTQPAPLDRRYASLTSYEPVDGQAALVGTPGTAEANSPVILVNETTGRTVTVLSRSDGSFSNSIPAEVDDTLSALMVNQNGTRNAVAVSRQLFADGSVGLFSGGGTLEVTNENGVAQFTIEPGAIERETIFKIQALTLDQTRMMLEQVTPTNGTVLAGFTLDPLRGSPLKSAIEVDIPIDPAQLGLPPGADPRNATFGLAIARVIDGQHVFQLIDSPRYEDGRLVTHTWQGMEKFLSAFESTFLICIGLNPGPMVTVQGRVVTVKLDSSGQPDLSSEEPLAGAVVRGYGDNQQGAIGSLRNGSVYCLSSSSGRFRLLTIAQTVSATHPRFPGLRADGVVPSWMAIPGLDPGLAARLGLMDLRFLRPDTGTGIPPLISVYHTPFYQDAGGTFTVTVTATDDDSKPTIEVEVDAVSALVPGQTVTTADVTIAPQAAVPDSLFHHKVTQGFPVTVRREAAVRLRVTATDGFQNPASQSHSLQFGGPAPSAVSGQIPPSDPRDRTGPRVLWSTPEPKSGSLTVGQPISIKFDEAISTDILDQRDAIVRNPAGQEPILRLSDDQTTLTLLYLDLEPGTRYRLDLISVQDLQGNRLDQDPVGPGDQSFKMEFTAGGYPAAELEPGATDREGTGAVVFGHYAFVIEQTGPALGKLAVFDLSDPGSPQKLVNAERGLAARPRDLILIPHYSFVYADPSIYRDPVRRRKVKPGDFDKILTRDLLVVVGGSPGLRSILRVFDVTKPDDPVLLAGTQLNDGESVATRVRWAAPTLYVLETGTATRITSINLQAHLIGRLQQENAEEFKKLTHDRPGRDVNEDGDYADLDTNPPEEPPFPSILFLDFPGQTGSYGLSDSSQSIRDFAVENRGAFQAAVVLPGRKKDERGIEQLDQLVPGGYRTLIHEGVPLTLNDGFYPILDGSARRLLTLFKQPIKVDSQTKLYDLALVPVSPQPPGGPIRLLVLDLGNPLVPTKLLDIPVPKGPGVTNLYSIYPRGDGLLVMASDTNSLLIDPAKFGLGILDPAKSQQAIVGMIPGAGGDAWTFGVSDSGLMVSGRLPILPAAILMPPVIEIVSFPEENPFLPQTWLQTNPTQAQIFDRLDKREVASALRLARFREEDKRFSVSTLKDPTTRGSRSVHYYALVKGVFGGSSPAQDSIELALESLNWAGAPLKKRGFLFPPVHGFSDDVLAAGALDQEAGDEDAKPRTCKAWRLSNDPLNPLYHVYLSRPFAVVAESLSKAELSELESTLERDILWSGYFLRVSIDPAEKSTPGLKPFVGQVKDGRYHPGVFTTLPSFPGDLLPSPNPMPIGGGATTIGLAGGLVGAHNSELLVDTVDLSIPGRRMPVAFGRHYSGQALYHGTFGRGWDINYNQRLIELSGDVIVPGYTNPVVVREAVSDSEYATNRDVLFYDGAGRVMVYRREGERPPPSVAGDLLAQLLGWVEPGGKAGAAVTDCYLPPAGAFSPMFRFQDGRFAMLDPDGTQRWFNRSGQLIAIHDRFPSNSILLSYGEEGELTSISSDGGTLDHPLRIDIGYFRTPNPNIQNPADIVTNAPALAGRVCQLMDHSSPLTGRNVLFAYDADGNLHERHGVDVRALSSPTGLGVPGRQVTRYSYSGVDTPDRTRKSLQEIRGPDRGPDIGGVRSARVDEYGTGGPDMVKRLLLGDRMVVTIDQTHGNTAKDLGAANPGRTHVYGPGATKGATEVGYEFDPYGRSKATTLIDGAGSGAPIRTGTDYDPSGRLLSVTLPEGNETAAAYAPNQPTLRNQVAVDNLTQAPGPRGLAGTFSADLKTDGLYNLPQGEQSDFRHRPSNVTLSPGSKSIESVSKGGESAAITYYPDGLLESVTTSTGVKRVYTYTPEGFLHTSAVGDANGLLTSTYFYTDPRFGPLGLPSSIMDDAGSTTLEYDELGRLIERKRGTARETFSYDGAGNLNEATRVVEASGLGGPRRLERRFKYDDFGNLTSRSIQDVEVAVATGPVVQTGITDLVTEYEYDDYYRVKAVTLPSKERREHDFDHAGRVTDVRVLAAGEEVSHVHFDYDLNGNLRTAQDHGATVSLTYDGHDRVHEYTTPAGATTSLAYDENSNLLSAHVESGGITLASTTLANYDDLDRPQNLTRATDTQPSTLQLLYPLGQRKVTTIDSRGASTTYETKQVGREWTETGPLGRVDLKLDYAGQGGELTETVTDGLGPSTTTAHFTELGHVDMIVDELQQTYSLLPETDGRLMESRLPTSQGPADAFRNTYSRDGLLLSSSRPDGQTLVRDYDARGNIVREAVRFPSGDLKGTTYNYDAAGRLTAVYDADGVPDRVIDANGDGRLDFNEFGQPTAIQTARGTTVGLAYDPIGRLKRVQFGNDYLAWDYDAFNRVTRAANANGTNGVAYGRDGTVRSVGVSQFGTTWAMPRQYNSEGARVGLKYPDGTDVSYGRDPAGRLLSVEPANLEPVVEESVYDGGALVTDRTLGHELIDVHIDYDGNRREIKRSYTRRAGRKLLVEVEYARDHAGLIRRRQLTHAGTTDYFDYDGSQRLTSTILGATATLADSSPIAVPPGAYGRTFDYSPTDVLIGMTPGNPHRLSVPAFMESASAIDNTLFAKNVTYGGGVGVSRGRDAAGNATNGLAFVRVKAQALPTGVPADAFATLKVTYTYDDLNQLVRVQREDGVTVENTYGPDGLRTRRAVHDPAGLGIGSDLEYVYDGINLIEIFDLAHNRQPVARFYYGDNGDELIAGDFLEPGSPTPKRFYYLTDSLGSPMAIVDAAGNVVEYYLYDAWGEATIRPPGAGLTPGAVGIHTRSAVGSPFYFQGQVCDEDAGLIYMRARFYDPALCLFLQRDPSGYVDSGNQYAGMANNPTNLRDPTGTLTDEEWETIRQKVYGKYGTMLSEEAEEETNALIREAEERSSFKNRALRIARAAVHWLSDTRLARAISELDESLRETVRNVGAEGMDDILGGIPRAQQRSGIGVTTYYETAAHIGGEVTGMAYDATRDYALGKSVSMMAGAVIPLRGGKFKVYWNKQEIQAAEFVWRTEGKIWRREAEVWLKKGDKLVKTSRRLDALLFDVTSGRIEAAEWSTARNLSEGARKKAQLEYQRELFQKANQGWSVWARPAGEEAFYDITTAAERTEVYPHWRK